jgi:outer membrane biosynthesis protein TonB
MVNRVASPLDAPEPRQRGASAVAGAGAFLAHGVLLLLAAAGAGVAREVSASLAVTEMVNVDLAPPVEEPKLPEPKRVDPTVHAALQPKPSKPAEAPPTAAAAGPALTADEVADSSDSIVTGTGPGYAGGVTDRAGTSLFVVREVGARGAGSAAPAVAPPLERDRSRAPQLAGGMRWDCPFPQEADIEGINRAVVSLRVDLSATGEVRAAQATTDPGFGFARVARRCALSKRWAPALGRDGKPVAATTVVTVRFDR